MPKVLRILLASLALEPPHHPTTAGGLDCGDEATD